MIKRFKDFYKRNRVYSILMIISILCIIAIGVGVLVYFLGQTSKSKYGNRLDSIVDKKINKERISILENGIEENELVEKVSIDIRGKLIYVDIMLKSGTHKESEEIANKSLELFSEEERGLYDIQFIVENKAQELEDNFPVMGYIKRGNTIIKWTNYVTKGE